MGRTHAPAPTHDPHRRPRGGAPIRAHALLHRPPSRRCRASPRRDVIVRPNVKRLLVPSAALLWGLQFAFLNPALALLLVALFDATPGEVGTVLAVYNASGFVASLALPAYADRTRDYLRVMLVCGLLTLALAGLLAVTMSLPVAVVGLVALGGPAGV